MIAGAIFAFAFNSFSQNKVLPDTSKQVLLAVAKPVKTKVVLREANVVFPEIFEEHRDKSTDYVEKYAKNKREHVITMYRRSGKYFPKVKSILKKYGVPAEFAVLMAIESGFNSKVVSRAGATGYWQFVDETAKEYGLKIIENQTPNEDIKPAKNAAKAPFASIVAVNTLVVKPTVKLTDDRENLQKSTSAAARYFRDMYRSLGDWLLVAAAYNCGLGRVKNAIAASGKSKPSFWDVKQYLPGETRAYVLNLVTLNVLFRNYKNFEKSDLIFKDIIGEETKMVPETIIE